MLSKCANPNCDTPLHYLRSGKIFTIEMQQGPVLVEEKKAIRRVEHFWLCGPCSEAQTVTYDDLSGVKIVPKVPMVRRAAAS